MKWAGGDGFPGDRWLVVYQLNLEDGEGGGATVRHMTMMIRMCNWSWA